MIYQGQLVYEPRRHTDRHAGRHASSRQTRTHKHTHTHAHKPHHSITITKCKSQTQYKTYAKRICIYTRGVKIQKSHDSVRTSVFKPRFFSVQQYFLFNNFWGILILNGSMHVSFRCVLKKNENKINK